MGGETQREVSGWSVDTLRYHMQIQLEGMRALLQERYETQTKAIEAAFLAQQTAMQTALLSAATAVTKAEVAAEKRFESVNEFRQTLSDQAATFMQRTEAETRMSTLSEKLDDASERNTERLGRLELRMQSVPSPSERDTVHAAAMERDAEFNRRLAELTHRIDLSQGHSVGSDDTKTNSRAILSLALAGISVFVLMISVSLTIVVALHR
jgi:hypothetical protein